MIWTEKSNEFTKFWNCISIELCSSCDFRAKFKEEAKMIDLIPPLFSTMTPSLISLIGTKSWVVFEDVAMIINLILKSQNGKLWSLLIWI
jgi:hypothetical protein